MKRLILIGLIVGLLAPVGLHGQRVFKEGSAVILDMSVAAGMPAGAATDIPKYPSFTPSQTALGANNDNNGSINATVYRKLEIAPHDLSGDGTIGIAGDTFTWVNAFNYCRNVKHNGTTGWRLPTQRELQMMWIFKPALNFLGVTAFASVEYWSSTESSATSSWIVDFSYGETYYFNSKTDTYRVRCVREIVTP